MSGRISSRTDAGVAGLMTTPTRLPSALTLCTGPRQVVVSFPVDEERIGACLDEVAEIEVRVRNHQVGLERQSRRRDATSVRPGIPPVMLGTKCPSITSTWNPIDPGRLDGRHLFTQPGEVGGEQRGRQFPLCACSSRFCFRPCARAFSKMSTHSR